MKPNKQSDLLKPTNEDTVGPYFPINFSDPLLEDLSRFESGITAQPQGDPIILKGRLIDRFGELANGTLVEFWQANAKGVYRSPKHEGNSDIDPWFWGYGRLRTESGEFEFKTIMPGPCAGRAPNITITLFSDGISRIVTQIFFADQAGNATDPLLQSLSYEDRAKLSARHEGESDCGSKIYTIDIVMAGENEIPFFDDLIREGE
jgi:protocatechuate 3,4-dioxygenase beta subunit